MSDASQAPLEVRDRGHWFEDFVVGQRYDHHWGRTVNEFKR